MCGNNVAMEEDVKRKFLCVDQEAMIRKFGLRADESYIWFNFLGKSYKLDRNEGYVTVAEGPRLADHDTTMAIYDLMTYSADSAEAMVLSGSWATIADLGGLIGAGHVQQKILSQEALAPFVGRVEELKEACRRLHGVAADKGEVSFQIPVFDFLPIWFQFWDEDDEFPASAQFLWDRKATDYLHYEILYYTTIYLEELLKEMIEE